MAKRKFRFFRIGGWILGGIVSLVFLLTVVFYLGREYFMGKAVTFLNEQQPGEVQMGKMNLIPFLNFPDVSLQLRGVNYYEKSPGNDSLRQQAILSLDEIYITLDLVELIRGGIMVSEARLKDGFVHMEVYEDSISNLENALGIRFGEQEAVEESKDSTSFIAIDMDKIELVNISLSMQNRALNEEVGVVVNHLESSFSYLEGLIRAAIEVDIDINDVKLQTFNENIDKNIVLDGSVLFDPGAHLIEVEPSGLRVFGLDFETWGQVNFQGVPRIDLAYTANNEGLELLNFLFRGILDLDEIEQIGEGSIHLNGTVQGALGDGELPVIRINGDAENLGFRIKALQKDVTGISFQLFATNGRKSDLSEGLLDLRGFTARFPEGSIKANISASNINKPELKIEVDGHMNLGGLDEVFETGSLSDLSGSVSLKGKLNGKVNRKTGAFLNDQGSLTAGINNVGFVMHGDSITSDTVSGIQGEIVLHENLLGTDSLRVDYNGNQIDLGILTENLLLYLFGFDKEVSAEITLSTELLNTYSIFRDTAMSGLLGEEISGLYFKAETRIEKEELDNYFDHDSLPDMELLIDSFGVSVPVYADISDFSASLSFGADSILLHRMSATIGQSSVDFSGILANYGAMMDPDSTEEVAFDFDISSGMMRAEDFFTYKGAFLLPDDYHSEYFKDFKLSGRLGAPAAGLLYDSLSMDFNLDVQNLGWNLRYYPSRFKDFLIQIRREGDLLTVENVQGSVGENNVNLSASLENFTDSVMGNIYGNMELYSDLMDFNQLLNYQQPVGEDEVQEADTVEQSSPLRLNEIDFPNIDFTVDIGELRYGKNTIYGMNGKFRSSKEKIFYLDKLVTSPEGQGTLEFNGQLNVSDPDYFTISAELDLKGIDISDLNLELQSEDTVMALKDHFQGIIDARGLAEIFITPDLKVDMTTSTAVFNLKVSDGALINFTPLQAAGKFLDSKDLNNVRFATLRNSFTMTDSKIIIPLMNVESTVGQLLIQGEQGLDNSFLYLVRVPPKLARQAARSAMAEGERDDGEDQVNQMKRGDFLVITLWSDGSETDFKLGDKRDKFQE